MNSTKFKVIKGGLDTKAHMTERKFISGYITDTRLMGVTGLFLNWEITVNGLAEDLHQFFYLEAEETGIESYTKMMTADALRLSQFETKMLTCLGGKKVYISEKEASFILQTYAIINKNNNIDFPSPFEEYGFLLSEHVGLTVSEYSQLIIKMCGETDDPFQVVNYFLMRSFVNDIEGVASLCEGSDVFANGIHYQADPNSLDAPDPGKPDLPNASNASNAPNAPWASDHQDLPDLSGLSDLSGGSSLSGLPGLSDLPDETSGLIFPGMTPEPFDFQKLENEAASTLCRNDIEVFNDANSISYVSESLIEGPRDYRIVTSEIILNPETLRVRSIRKFSSFRISSQEAAMKLTHPEFITLYDICCDRDFFEESFEPYVLDCTETEYDSGQMYIRFNRDNRHVSKSTYQMHEDVSSVFYLSDYGQLIVASYSVEEMRQSEDSMKYSHLGNLLNIEGRFQFKDPVIYDFIYSGIDDFMSYLDFVRY